MAKRTSRRPATPNRAGALRRGGAGRPGTRGVEDVLLLLRAAADARTREQMEPRYGITTDRALGVPMNVMIRLARDLKRADAEGSHDLALALWDTGWYEARTVAAMIADPGRLTAVQMDRWAGDFDNWAICDTVCFKLFDRVDPELAFRMIDRWAKREREEFIKRAGFALLACVALHDGATGDEPFRDRLALIERGATDGRNFVKKAVSWALRSIATRSASLRRAASDTSRRLATSEDPAARWVGKDALKALAK